MAEWQPIETAPKDGTVILGFDARGFECGEESEWPDQTIAPMRWMDGPDGFEWFLPWLSYSSPMHDDIGPSWFRVEFDPTHWMPLPEPPQ